MKIQSVALAIVMSYLCGQKGKLTAWQASERSGVLYCQMKGKRVILGGKAAIYSEGYIHIPEE